MIFKEQNESKTGLDKEQALGYCGAVGNTSEQFGSPAANLLGGLPPLWFIAVYTKNSVGFIF